MSLAMPTIQPNGLRHRPLRSAPTYLLVVFLIVLGVQTASAQEPAATPAATPSPSARETELNEENRLLELEKKNAELKKAIRESQPEPSSTPLEGKTTADDHVIIETQMVTYKAMSDVADRIGKEIHSGFPAARSIAIIEAAELENLKHYRAFSPILDGRIQGLKKQYEETMDRLARIPKPRPPVVTLQPARNNLISPTLSAVTVETSSALVSPNVAAVTAGPGAAVAAATVGLRTFADLLALMRTDTEIKGKSTSVQESALVAETFRALRNRFPATLRLYYLKAVTPEINLEGCRDGNNRVYCSETLQWLAGLYADKERADTKLLEQMFDVTQQLDSATRRKAAAEEEIKSLAKQINDLKLERLKAELTKPWTAAQVAKFDSFVAELKGSIVDAETRRTSAASEVEYNAKKKDVLEQMKSLNQRADQLVADLTKADEKTGQSELANFLRAENLDKVMTNDSYWLQVKSISAGGNNRTRQNLFRYFSGAKLDHSGGIIIEWALYDQNGNCVASNKDSSYPGYYEPKQIANGKLEDTVADRPARPVVAKSGDQ